MMHEPQGPLLLPHVPFATKECEGMEKVIKGYIELLQKTPLFPQQETQGQRNRRIQLLNGVAGRLSQQLAVNPTAIQLPLNAEEAEEIMNALTGFATCAQQTLAPGVERDYLLSVIEGWRVRLICYLLSCPGIDALN
jgi:hypothetical protein